MSRSQCTVFFKLRVWSSPPARSTGPWAVTLFFFRLPFLRQPETRYRWPAWPRLGPACLSPYLQLISESLGPAMRPGAEAAGNETPDADWLRLGSASAGLGGGGEDPEPGKRGLGCQPVTPLGRATRPCLQAPPVRRAVSSAAVRIGSRPTAWRSLARGNGGPADSWTSHPCRPAARDLHHPDCSRQQHSAQPA